MTNALEVASLFARLTLVDDLTPELVRVSKALDAFSVKAERALGLFGAVQIAAHGAGGLTVIEPRADGGPVAGNRPYLVGERGPELYVPSSSGTIIPNDRLGGGGQPVVVTVNNYGSSPYEFAELVQRALRDQGI